MSGPMSGAPLRPNKKIKKAATNAAAAPSQDGRRALADEKISAHIERLVASCPPLTPGQIDRLSLLMRGGAS